MRSCNFVPGEMRLRSGLVKLFISSEMVSFFRLKERMSLYCSVDARPALRPSLFVLVRVLDFFPFTITSQNLELKARAGSCAVPPWTKK
uniref:Uncharacterized protein n=1 Tax=Oryza brachyantha TaxID=4533 RepID=J3MRM6_ORYBR